MADINWTATENERKYIHPTKYKTMDKLTSKPRLRLLFKIYALVKLPFLLYFTLRRQINSIKNIGFNTAVVFSHIQYFYTVSFHAQW